MNKNTILLALCLIVALAVTALVYTGRSPGPGVDKGPFEVDGMSIGIPESEFVKLRPQAKAIFQSDVDKTAEYLYIPQTETLMNEAKVISLARGFQSGGGCAVGVGLNIQTVGEAEKLTQEITADYRSMGKPRALGDSHQIQYFENDERSASIISERSGQDGFKLSFSSTLKSCGPKIAERWQTVPRSH